jgi:hypothetical protein
MKAHVVYESMYGNTRHIAEAIADGLRVSIPTDVALARDDSGGDLDDVDLVVVGAPTHAWGLSGQRSREAAVLDATKHPDHLFDCAPCAPGVREWLHEVKQPGTCRGVAFETRLAKPKLFTGSAARAIQRGLHRAGFETFAKAHSFSVTGMAGPLAPGEIERAQRWGVVMGLAIVGLAPRYSPPTKAA